MWFQSAAFLSEYMIYVIAWKREIESRKPKDQRSNSYSEIEVQQEMTVATGMCYFILFCTLVKTQRYVERKKAFTERCDIL